MIKSIFQKHYEDLLAAGNYGVAFEVLRKNPDILGLDHEDRGQIHSNLSQVYARFHQHLPEDALKNGLTDVLRQITGDSGLDFVFG